VTSVPWIPLDKGLKLCYIISGREEENERRQRKMQELVRKAKQAGADREALYRAVKELVMALEGYGLERSQITFMQFFLTSGRPEEALRSAELAVQRIA